MAGPKQRTPKGPSSTTFAAPNSSPKPSQSKPSKRTKPTSSSTTSTMDPRFANIQTDPRFRLPSRKNQRVKLDSRFERLLTDDAFAQKASVDRYGRRLDSGSGRKNLERFYRIDGDEEKDRGESGEDEDEDGVAKAKYDPARQGGFDVSSSEEEDSDDDKSEDGSDEDDSDVDESDLEAADDEDLDEEMLAEQTAGREARGAEIPEGEVSTRIAVVNMDWDNVRAVDLMAVATSFCPVGGRLLKCVVYPSEFGRERMEREEVEGPPKELFTGRKSKKSRRGKHGDGENESEEEDDEEAEARIRKELLEGATEESTEIDSRALRAYQLSRLRYYYAVMTFDTEATAHAVYMAMDGREYLSSANFFDLRFVPEETSFDTDKPRDECSRVPQGYRPGEFVTEALTHSKVRLTWDADDSERKEIQKRAFGRQEIDENDLRAYVGSDSSEDEDDISEHNNAKIEVVNGETGETTAEPKLSKAEEARRKMRLALGLPVEDAPSKKSKGKVDEPVVGDMQITFSAGLSSDIPDKKSKTGVFENSLEDVRQESTLEKYKRKEKERKARRKEKAKAAREGVDIASASASEDEGQSSTSEAEDEIVLDETAHPDADAAEEEEEDDPFNDPFFTNPSAANASARKASKAAKRKAAEEAAAVEEAARAKDKAQLELLMAADRAENGVSSAEHFNMTAIRKAEKANEGKKKGKWAKKQEARKAKDGKSTFETGGEQNGFEVDVADPRFKGLFDSHEFAIDPSNPRFSGTKAMKKLLEEGRKKRKVETAEDAVGTSQKEKRPAPSSELTDLVKKVKKRKV